MKRKDGTGVERIVTYLYGNSRKSFHEEAALEGEKVSGMARTLIKEALTARSDKRNGVKKNPFFKND